MQVILDSRFTRPGSVPIWDGKKGEFRDWTISSVKLNTSSVLLTETIKLHVKFIAISVSVCLTPRPQERAIFETNRLVHVSYPRLVVENLGTQLY